MKLFRIVLAIAGAVLIAVSVVPLSAIGNILIYSQQGSNPGVSGSYCAQGSQDIVGSYWHSLWFNAQQTALPTEVNIYLIADTTKQMTLQVRIVREASPDDIIAEGIVSATARSYVYKHTIAVNSVGQDEAMYVGNNYDYRIEVVAWDVSHPVCIGNTPAFEVWGRAWSEPPPEGCDPGWHWDIALGYCVQNEPPPEGVDCDPGWHWDEEAGECVIDAVPPQDQNQTDEGGGDELCRFPMLFIIGLALILIAVFWRH